MNREQGTRLYRVRLSPLPRDDPVLPARLTGYLRSLCEDELSSDAALLARYAEDCDAGAFELLVWRHGSLVLGICRRILRDHHAAEDAFQATFLILSKRAGSIRGSLSPWLHSVARRICLRSLRRRMQPLPVDVPGRTEKPAVEHRELLAVLDAEIAKLPEKHRRVVVLCYLQNRTAEEAGRELGIPRGTVLSRLDAARRKLQVALTHRGIAPLAILAIPLIHAPPSAALVKMTQAVVGCTASGFLSTPITELAHEVLQMTTRKWIAGSALGIIALAFASTGVVLFQSDGPATSQAMAQAPAAKPDKPAAPDDAKQEKIKEQLSQRDALRKTEWELRLDILSLRAEYNDPEISPRALMQAIDKIDEGILRLEEELPRLKAALDYEKKEIRPEKDYKIKLGDVMSKLGTELEKAVFERDALYINYRKAMQTLTEDMSKVAKTAGMNDPKYVAILTESQKLADDFMNTAVPMLIKYDPAEIREVIHARHLEAISIRQQAYDSVAHFPNSVAKRRGLLVEQLRKTDSAVRGQKLLEDELQLLYEFRKAVLKQKLTLKLEMDGVKLPEEPKK